MITFWKDQNGLVQLQQFEPNCWIDVENPNPEEISFLTDRFKIPVDCINDILDIDERSRAEFEDDWMLIILRIPYHYKNNGVPFITIPLGILISNRTIVTICQSDNEITADIRRLAQNRKISFTDLNNFILHIFLSSATWFLKFLKQINAQTSLIEKDLEKSTKNKELNKLLKMEKCLVYFMTSLKANELLLSKLKNSRFLGLNDINEDLLEDVIIEIKQGIEMANIYSDIQSGLMDAFASIISNNLNNKMKQLTSITIILMIPTLVGSFFGMNVPNFLETSKYSFFIIIFLSIGLSALGAFLFRKSEWF